MDDSLMESASYLRRLVKQVPQPIPVDYRSLEVPSDEWPTCFGASYHGLLSTRATAKLLLQEGSYLVRQGKIVNCATLSFRVNGSIHHYRLHYDGAFWVKPEKKFNILIDLVSDGLRVLFMDQQWRLLVTLLQNKLPDGVKRVSFRTTGHEFKRSFIWMRKCSVCGQSGVFANLKCRECGVESHERCALSCTEKCHNSGRIFGVELDKLVKLDDSKRPFILEMCIEEIERRGLDAEGLYRVSGFSDEIEALKNAFERDGKQTDLSPKTYDNVHVLTGVLKKWLRMLPSSLIDESVRNELFQALTVDGEFKRDLMFANSLRKLSPAQYSTLSLLMTHLRRVINQEGNKMNSRNMAIVLAPTLLPYSLHSLENNIKVIDVFLKRYEFIFTDG